MAVLVLFILGGAAAPGDLVGPAVDDPRLLLGETFRPGKAMGSEYVGLLTAYGADPHEAAYGVLEGGCGYGLLNKADWPGWNAVALRSQDTPLLDDAATRPRLGCGMCLQVACVDPAYCRSTMPVTAVVTDICPTCTNAMHIDGHASWVNKIATVPNALVTVQRVQCVPPASDGVVVVVMNYAGPLLWLRMRAEKVAGPGVATLVQVQDQCMASVDDSWQDLTNTWGAVWEAEHSPARPTVRFRVWNELAAHVTTEWIVLVAGQHQDVRFPQPRPVQFRHEPLENLTVGAGDTGNGYKYSSCVDVPPDPRYTCAQQRLWGKCNEPWMTKTQQSAYGYCARTCGRCTPAGHSVSFCAV